jgi:hypothetical protein
MVTAQRWPDSRREWTRTQRIRTAAELPISADLVDGQPYRKYAALAERSRHLTELGMTQAEIAVALKTTPRTIRRALRVRERL